MNDSADGRRVAVRALERLVVLAARPYTQAAMLRDLDGRTDPERLLVALARMGRDPEVRERQEEECVRYRRAQQKRADRRRRQGRKAQRRYLAHLRKAGGPRLEAYLAEGRARAKRRREARRLDAAATAGAPCGP